MSASTDLRFDTGRICLDLLATVGGNLSSSPVERLDGVARLDAWLHGAGVVPVDEPLDLDAEALDGFLALRARLHRIVHAELDGTGPTDDDLAALNRTAAAGPLALRLDRTPGAGLHCRTVTPPDLADLLGAVAQDAVRLFGSPDRALLRECEGPTCDLVYVDASRGRRRRWCSASACANRHYVAAHRARRSEAGPPSPSGEPA
ncbi:ABATE domain-containing protein [Kitasatospora sp. NA04385]|uniref:CGNR zinc finger domain-containing protein n=1 Tax=Kitasatospora sp. NA04385 TaxID=2742135 RepID=UPI0015928F8C|nr:ABATE domain-containing protein [Kitasatospora sp. NA04385]QKW21205.1 ABATE domain-containing protein [Kitasatospora sp. NA04385]